MNTPNLDRVLSDRISNEYAMLTNEELRDLIALGEKATERPWCQWPKAGGDMEFVYADNGNGRVGWVLAESLNDDKNCTNAAFITASANIAVPLAEEVLTLRSDLAALRGERDALRKSAVEAMDLLQSAEAMLGVDEEAMKKKDARIHALEACLRAILVDYDSGDWGANSACNEAERLLAPRDINKQ